MRLLYFIFVILFSQLSFAQSITFIKKNPDGSSSGQSFTIPAEVVTHEDNSKWEKDAWATGTYLVKVTKMDDHSPNMKAQRILQEDGAKRGLGRILSLCPILNPLTEPPLHIDIVQYCAKEGFKQHLIALAIYEARLDGKDDKWGHAMYARRYMKEAAEAGYPKAMFSYAVALIEGYGGTINMNEAEKWYDRLDSLKLFDLTEERKNLKSKKIAYEQERARNASREAREAAEWAHAWEIAEQLRYNSKTH